MAATAGAALDLPLCDERWLDLLSTPGAMFLQPDVVGWLHRQYRPGLDERAAATIRASDDDWHLYYAIGAFAMLSEEVARAFINNDQRHALSEAQADAGDADAQLALVDKALGNQRSGERSPPLRFAHAVADVRLVEPLSELLGLLGPSGGGASDDLQRSVVQALAATRSVVALRAYDRLMENGSFESAFFWYPRIELAQGMAREQVLGRLPERVAEVPTVLEEHGWRTEMG